MANPAKELERKELASKIQDALSELTPPRLVPWKQAAGRRRQSVRYCFEPPCSGA